MSLCECEWRNLPVERNRAHWIYGSEDGGYREEVVESAVIESEIPLVVHGVNKVYNGVECGHWRFSERQVHKEIVRHGSHSFVRQNDPYYRNIAHHGDNDNCAVSYCPEHYPPSRLHKLVPVYLGFILFDGVVCPVTLEVIGSDERIHSYRENVKCDLNIVSFLLCWMSYAINVQSTMFHFEKKGSNCWVYWRKRCSEQYSSIFSDKGRWCLCSFKQDRRTDRNGLFLYFSSSRNQF